MARSAFKLKSTHSGGASSFKMMGASPAAPATPGESPTKQRWLIKNLVDKAIKHSDDIGDGIDYVKNLFRKSDGRVKKNLKKKDVDDAMKQQSKKATDDMKSTYGGGRNKALAVAEDVVDVVMLDAITGSNAGKAIYNSITGMGEVTTPEVTVTPNDVIPYSPNSTKKNEGNFVPDTSKNLLDNK